MSKKRSGKVVSLPVVDANAAGIDIGATQIFVAVPADRDVESIRCFDTFTADLERLVDWLELCQIRTVAMESTGVYWIPLFHHAEHRIVKQIQSRTKSGVQEGNVPGVRFSWKLARDY